MSFDAREPGTSEREWAAEPRFGELGPLSLSGLERIVVVAAHPDDETLGAGGLIATASASGIRVDVVVVTDGGASHPDSPTHSASELAGMREAEVRLSLGIIAPHARVHFLRFVDGHIASIPSTIREGIRSILGVADSATAIVSPARLDGHRDHRIVGEACAELSRDTGARLIEYLIWFWHWAKPDDETMPWTRLRRLPLDPQQTAMKRRAVRVFASQQLPLSDAPGDEAILREDFLEHFERDTEHFLVVEPGTAEPNSALRAEYFDAKYDASADPWGFETRWYEERKRAITTASLPAEHYGRVLEIGCSIGVLTSQLAPICDDLLAVDVSHAAVASAQARLAGQPHVTIELRDVDADFPGGTFDLVVLSEVGYYFDRDGLKHLLEAISAALAPGGTLLACHWRHPVHDYPLTGDFVHGAIAQHTDLHRLVSHVERDFLLEVFSTDGRSVAERAGLA